MDDRKISDPNIDFVFEEDNENYILSNKTETSEFGKLKKRINYITFFTFILISALTSLFYFNLSGITLEIKDGGALKIENLSKEIDAKIATLSALSADSTEDMAKRLENLKKEAIKLEKNFNNISDSLKKIDKIEQALKNKTDKEELQTISESLTKSLNNKITSENFQKMSEELNRKIQTSVQTSLDQSLTKAELENRMEVFEKNFRIKILRITGDAETLIASAKLELEKDIDKKISGLIKDFEINIQNYIRRTIQNQQQN